MATQKVALITAGTAGLGAAVARALATEYRVVINYANNSERASSVLEELNKIPSKHSSPESPRCHAIQADVGDKAALQRLVKETISKMGRLDVVVSNAGWTRLTNFMNFDEQVEEDDWDKCFLYNVKAHAWLAYAAKDELIKNEGAFITTASVAAVKPSGSSLPYAVTKAAAVHLSKCLANILAPKVRVNSVSPGLLMTEWGMKFPESKREAHRNGTKLKRFASLEDCADQIKLLAASQSITSQNIVIDCGMT